MHLTNALVRPGAFMLDILSNLRDSLYLALILATKEQRPGVRTNYVGHLWREGCRRLQRFGEKDTLAALSHMFRSDRLDLLQLSLVKFIFGILK